MLFTRQVSFLTLVLFLLCSQNLYSQSMGEESLSHLEGVNIYIAVQGHAKGKGISKQSIKEDIEKQLRESNIKIYTEKNYTDYPSSPTLYMALNGYERENRLSFSVNTIVNQNVYTVKDEQVRASTYIINPSIGSIRMGNTKPIREIINKKVRTFINDWASVH